MTVHIHPESSTSFSAESIAKALGNGKEQRTSTGWLTCCPVHGDKNPSLAVKDCTDSHGRPDVSVKCFAGCDYKAVKDELRSKELLPKWRPPQNRSAVPTTAKGKDNLPAHIWETSRHDQAAAETIQKAFALRRIQLEQIPPNIRLNNYKGQLSIACAMQSPLDENPPAKPQCVHLTLLDEEGKKKKRSETSPSTKYHGPKTGLAVMLPGKDRSHLVIGEGLETTFSAVQAMGFSGMVCGDAGNMAGMSRLPEKYQEIFILVDSDPSHAGQNAALKAGENISKANPQAAVWLVAPDDSCFTDAPVELDFNDLLKQDTSGGSIRARFERKKRLDEIDWRPKEKEQPAKAAELEKKKTPEVWSFADVEEILEQNPELLKWMVCAAPDKALSRMQKNAIADEILQHNSFSPLERDAVKDMLKKKMGISKGAQDQVLYGTRLAKTESVSGDDDERTHAELASDFIKRFYPDRKQQIGAEGELWKYNAEKGIFEEIKLNKVEFSIGTAFRGDYCKRGSDYKSIARLIYNHLEQPIFFSEAPYGIPTRSCFIRLADDGSIRKEPYTPEHRVRYTLNVDAAEPGTRAPLFSRYLEDSFKGSGMEEQILLLQEIMGAILTGCFSRQQKAVLLYGDGENGKSVLLELLDNMFLQKMKAAIPPEQFDNPYYLAMLAGKFVNIVGEVDKSKPLTATFKDVVGCDTPITARLPYKEPFEFKPRAAHIFSANNFPQSNDHSHGFYRRWIILSFRNVVHPDRKIQNLGATIASEEMPQVMAWALQGAERLAKNRHVLTSTSAHEECLNEWKNAKDSVFSFFHDEDEVELTHESNREPHKKVYEAYTSWCHDNGFKSTGYQEFLKRSGRFIKSNVRFPGEQRSFAGLRLLR